MARKPDEHMALPVTEQFAQDGARFDTLLMDMAKVLFTPVSYTHLTLPTSDLV